MSRRSYLAVLALAAVAAGCADRSPAGPSGPADSPAPTGSAATPAGGGERAGRAAEERLARRMARALADPAFRAYVKDALDRSPVREHKLHFQRFLRGPDRKALRALARTDGETESAVDIDATTATALEFYMPVPAHRAAWHGGDDVLVATARGDHEVPVAFDVRGNRHQLSPDAPPAIPVLALVPVETDFDTREVGLLMPGGGPVPPPPPPGLYMTSSHFVRSFEGWLKGNPEFEIHILGQSGASDSLTSYQCAGEHAPAGYVFDQNNLDWTGSVMLFSQTQLTNYQAAHPNQNVRILAIEDDDGACQIRLDGTRFKTLQTTLQNNYPNLTGGKDTTSGLAKVFKRANALQRILRSAYSWLTSQDDLIGNAIEDTVVGEYHAGANWVVRGENNLTNGWLKLQMR